MLTQVIITVIIMKLYIKSIAKAFEENGQLVSKHRGSVRYPTLQDEYIQWLVERLDADLNIARESLHDCELSEVFQFPCHVLLVVFQKPFEAKLDLPSS